MTGNKHYKGARVALYPLPVFPAPPHRDCDPPPPPQQEVKQPPQRPRRSRRPFPTAWVVACIALEWLILMWTTW